MLSKNVKRLREKEGIGKTELARRCGLSTRTIEFIEYGETSPTLRTLNKLSKYFKVDIADLIK